MLLLDNMFMSETSESGYSAGKRKAAYAVGGVVTLASVMWAVNHHRETEEERLQGMAQEEETRKVDQYKKQTAILLEPRLRETRLLVVQAAAAIIAIEQATKEEVARHLGVSKPKNYISTVVGHLRDKQLAMYIQPSRHDEHSTPYLEALPPLQWAASQPEEHPELAIELRRIREELKTSES